MLGHHLLFFYIHNLHIKHVDKLNLHIIVLFKATLVCARAHTHTHTLSLTHTHKHTHTNTHTQTHKHTNTHTHTNVSDVRGLLV